MRKARQMQAKKKVLHHDSAEGTKKNALCCDRDAMCVIAQHVPHAAQEQYQRLIENLKDEYFFYRHGVDGVLTYVSPSILAVLGYEPAEALMHYADYLTNAASNKKSIAATTLSMKGVKQPSYEVEVHHKNGSIHVLEVNEAPVFDDHGKVIAVEGIARDITAQRSTEAHLQEAYRVVEAQKRMLEEKNMVLREVISAIDKEKECIKQTIAGHAEKILLPIVLKIKAHMTEPSQQVYCDLLESSIKELTVSFGVTITEAHEKLTSREIEICMMVRSGMTGKEIAKILNLAHSSVETHRKNIRKKLRLSNTKINLSTHLKKL